MQKILEIAGLLPGKGATLSRCWPNCFMWRSGLCGLKLALSCRRKGSGAEAQMGKNNKENLNEEGFL